MRVNGSAARASELEPSTSTRENARARNRAALRLGRKIRANVFLLEAIETTFVLKRHLK